jgi:hypothetical protein
MEKTPSLFIETMHIIILLALQNKDETTFLAITIATHTTLIKEWP